MIEQEKDCPFCISKIPSAAKKCRFCGETVDVTLRAAEEAVRASNGKAPQQVFMNAPASDGGDPLATKSGPNHILHLLITLFTLGAWLPVWILIIIFSGKK